MNVQETLIANQAEQRAMLTALGAQIAAQDAHWQREFARLETAVLVADAKAARSETILATFKTRGATTLTIVGLAGTFFGALVVAKTAGMWLALHGWLVR